MTTQINYAELVKSIQSVDRAAGSALRAAAKVAELLVADHDPAKPFMEECERMMKVAKEAATNAKITLKHDRNVWLYIKQQLIVQMEPGATVEIKAGTDKHGPVTKRAEDCHTARDIQKAVKQIREHHGATDGRANNAPKRSDANVKLAQQVAERIVEDHAFLTALRAELKKVNYSLTVARSTVKAKKTATKNAA